MSSECRENGVSEVFCKRYSPRAFSEELVTEDMLKTLFGAARLAPSAFNEQPWRYIVAVRSDGDSFEKLLGCLAEGNRIWAKRAAALAVLVVKRNFDYDGKPNPFAEHDCGMSLENLLLQATDLGLATHPMGGILREKVRETYGVPEDFEPISAVAIGFKGDPEILPEDMREGDLVRSGRKPLDELIFAGKWEDPFF